MIKIKNMKLRFLSSSTLFFDGLEMAMEKGKLHILTGKNGAGKSTLFAALRGDIGTYAVAEGEIRSGNATYRISSNSQKPIVGYVPQSFDTLIADQFSFKDNLCFAHLKRYPSLFRGFGLNPSLPPFVKRFGIPENIPVKLLSGGQRQILALLMALQMKRELILLDEPTATLDPVNARMVFEFIHAIITMEQVTALVISHDHALASEFCTGSSFELHAEPDGVRRLSFSRVG